MRFSLSIRDLWITTVRSTPFFLLMVPKNKKGGAIADPTEISYWYFYLVIDIVLDMELLSPSLSVTVRVTE